MKTNPNKTLEFTQDWMQNCQKISQLSKSNQNPQTTFKLLIDSQLPKVPPEFRHLAKSIAQPFGYH